MGKIQRPKIAKNNMPAPFIMTKPLAKKGKKKTKKSFESAEEKKAKKAAKKVKKSFFF